MKKLTESEKEAIFKRWSKLPVEKQRYAFAQLFGYISSMNEHADRIQFTKLFGKIDEVIKGYEVHKVEVNA